MNTARTTTIGLTALALALAGAPEPVDAQPRGNAYGYWANVCREQDRDYRRDRRYLEREHRELHRDLDKIHGRWHREYDRRLGERRWRREHDELHRWLEVEHRDWHRQADYRLDRYDYRHDRDGRWSDRDRWRDDDWDDDRDDDDRYGRNQARYKEGRDRDCGPASRRGRVYRDHRGGSTWSHVIGGIRIEIPWPR